MKVRVKPRSTGKSFSAMIQLKVNILRGLSCSVITLYPEKFKSDFEYMTGSKLKLEIRENCKDEYNAFLG